MLTFAALRLAAAEPMVVDAVAADVGGRHITVAEVMEAARDSISAEGAISATALAEKLPGAYAEALTNLITRQLILIRYDQAKQKLPNWLLNRRVEAIIEEHFGGDRSLLVSMLAKRGLSYAKWRKKIEEDTIITAMRSQFVDQGIVVKPEDILAVYERDYANRKLPGPIRAALILLRPEEGQSAEAAVLVLVDASGSMWGPCCGLASAAMLAVLEALDQVKGVQAGAAAFSASAAAGLSIRIRARIVKGG